MHFSWGTGGNEQWFSYCPPNLGSATFLFHSSRGNILDTTSCDRFRIRKIEESGFSRFNTSRATWRGGRGSGYPHFIYMKALSFSIYRTATAPWNKSFFFFKRKKGHDFISNLSLPFGAGNWKQSREEAASGGSWMLTGWNIHTESASAYSSYLAAFYCMYGSDER